MPDPQYNLLEGLRRKTAGQEAAANGYGAADWLDKARGVARYLAISDGEVTIDSVLKLLPRPPHVAPNACGSVFKGKGWLSLGFVPTTKVAGRGRMVRRWAWRDNIA